MSTPTMTGVELPTPPDGVEYVYSDATDLPVGVVDKRAMTPKKKAVMAIIAVIAAAA